MSPIENPLTVLAPPPSPRVFFFQGGGGIGVRVRLSHVFEGKMHFRGGLHLFSQNNVASSKHLPLKP